MMNEVAKKYKEDNWQYTPRLIEKSADPFGLLEPFFNNWTIGFNTPLQMMRDLHSLKPSTQYPPYNIIETGENKFEIQLALAGMSKDDLKVVLENDRLSIMTVKSGTDSTDTDRTIHKGIASRSFIRQFIISPDIVVVDATMENGLLTISLEREIPDSKKPKTITIN